MGPLFFYVLTQVSLFFVPITCEMAFEMGSICDNIFTIVIYKHIKIIQNVSKKPFLLQSLIRPD